MVLVFYPIETTSNFQEKPFQCQCLDFLYDTLSNAFLDGDKRPVPVCQQQQTRMGLFLFSYSAVPPSTGNAANRDSINVKIFEEKGVGFGEGEEKLSKKVSPPPPQSLHILFKTPRPGPSLRQDRRFRRAFRIRGYGWPAPGGGPDGCWLRAPSLPPAPCGSSKGSAACYKCSSKRADSS